MYEFKLINSKLWFAFELYEVKLEWIWFVFVLYEVKLAQIWFEVYKHSKFILKFMVINFFFWRESSIKLFWIFAKKIPCLVMV